MINSDALRLIKEQAQMKEKENWAFYNFLKGNRLSDEEIDKKVWRLTQRFSKITNCPQCRNCCKVLHATFTGDEISLLQQHGILDLTLDLTTIFDSPADSLEYEMKSMPCYFLKNNQCQCGDMRPELCKTFPYLMKSDFTYCLHGVIENYAICPIVFNVVEQLKKELNFHFNH